MRWTPFHTPNNNTSCCVRILFFAQWDCLELPRTEVTMRTAAPVLGLLDNATAFRYTLLISAQTQPLHWRINNAVATRCYGYFGSPL